MPRSRRAALATYTDQILAGYVAAATGRIQAASVAGVQAAAGIVGRALASATIENDGGAVDPHLLEGVGTDLIRSGRFLGRLTVGPRGRVRILRACAAPSVTYGNSDPESWIYWLQESGPSEARTVRAVASEVVNVRINSDSRRPWEGVPPLARAVASGQLAARLAASLGDEADIVVSRIIPIAQGSGETAANQLSKAILGCAPGRLAFPETQLAGAAQVGQARRCETLARRGPGGSHQSAGRRSTRIFSAKWRKSVACPVRSSIRPARGLPRAKHGGGLTVGTCEPTPGCSHPNSAASLERPVTIKLRRLGGVDAAGRARALHVLTEAGSSQRQRRNSWGGTEMARGWVLEDSEIDPLDSLAI